MDQIDSVIDSPRLQLFTNRASRLFAKAAESVEPLLPANKLWRFSYWSEFYGANPDAQPDDIRLVEKEVVNQLENKGWVARRVIERGLESLFPRSCFSTAEALIYKDDCPLWFSKPVHLSGGRGIECLASNDLMEYELPNANILQQGIQKLALIDGRKFTARVYVLVWNKQLWLFDEGFVLLHGVPFDPESVDYEVHVDHRGYDKADSPVEMRLLTSLIDFEQRWSTIQAATSSLKPLFQEVLSASSHNRYLLLGIDFLLQKDGGLQFIEVNAIPNFVHSHSINNQLNIPFFTEALKQICELEAPRLIRL